MTLYAHPLNTDEALAMPFDPEEADLTQAIEAPAHLVDMDTGEILSAPAANPLAPAAMDGEWISREARLQTLEAMAEGARDQYVRANLEIGQILREHRDLCRAKTAADGRTYENRFDRLVARLGFTIRHAYQLITVACGVAQLPSLTTLANRNWSKALTLIQGTTEEQIAQIASGQSDLTLDEIDKMPVRKLKVELRRLETEKDKLIARETAVLRKERDDLVKDVARLSDLTGDDLDSVRRTVQRLTEEVDRCVGTLTGLYRQIDALPLEETMSPQGRLILNRIEGQVSSLATAGKDLWTHWFERRTQDWGYDA
jgi:hypothetical protein